MELTYAYVSAAELEARLRAVAAACGGRATVVDVGASVQGRPITAVKLSTPKGASTGRDNAGIERDDVGIEQIERNDEASARDDEENTRDDEASARDDAGFEGFERGDAELKGFERDDVGFSGFERDDVGFSGFARDHEEIERDHEEIEHKDEDAERAGSAEGGATASASRTRRISAQEHTVDVEERERASQRKRAVHGSRTRSAGRTRPAVKLVANMHGDEVVGRQLLLNLLEKMCGADGGDDDARVALVRDNIDLYLLPSMNPDGLEAYRLTSDNKHDLVGQRNNANDVDLNRNFPEPSFGDADSAKGREPETAALMTWIHSQPWTLSANLHGGALVANYPWDAKPTDGTTTTTDDATFRYLASTYANAHPTMPLGRACPGDAWAFPGGITQGWRWYDVAGGMQDYNYYYARVMEITVEVACTKWPAESTLPSYWAEHQASLFDYVLLPLRIGITGTVVDTAGSPIAGAVVSLDEAPGWTVTTDNNGVFWRLAAPGATYTVRATASGYHAATAGTVVTGGTYDPPVLTLALARDYTVAIAVGTVFGIVVLLALAAAFFWWWRRRRGSKGSAWKCASCLRRRAAPTDDEMSRSLADGDADGDDL